VCIIGLHRVKNYQSCNKSKNILGTSVAQLEGRLPSTSQEKESRLVAASYQRSVDLGEDEELLDTMDIQSDDGDFSGYHPSHQLPNNTGNLIPKLQNSYIRLVFFE
jgi:hypothetical protein